MSDPTRASHENMTVVLIPIAVFRDCDEFYNLNSRILLRQIFIFTRKINKIRLDVFFIKRRNLVGKNVTLLRESEATLTLKNKTFIS